MSDYDSNAVEIRRRLAIVASALAACELDVRNAERFGGLIDSQTSARVDKALSALQVAQAAIAALLLPGDPR